jgi:hypothetical protein
MVAAKCRHIWGEMILEKPSRPLKFHPLGYVIPEPACLVIFLISGSVKSLQIHQHSNHQWRHESNLCERSSHAAAREAQGAIVAGVGLSHT